MTEHPADTPAEERPHPYVQNMALAAVAGQAGCASLVIILTALLLGLWLDGAVHAHGIITVLCLVGSVPFSLWVMVKIALGAVGRLVSQQDPGAKKTKIDR